MSKLEYEDGEVKVIVEKKDITITDRRAKNAAIDLLEWSKCD